MKLRNWLGGLALVTSIGAVAGCTAEVRTRPVVVTPPVVEVTATAPTAEVVVETAPPAPIVEVEVARPGFVFVRGYHEWVGGRYVWRAGHYEAERRGHVWQHAHYENRGGRHVFIPGRWVRR
jgi:hypothetical protein